MFATTKTTMNSRPIKKTMIGKKRPANPNIARYATIRVKLCQNPKCNNRVKMNSTRVFCYMHDTQYQMDKKTPTVTKSDALLALGLEMEKHDETKKSLKKQMRQTKHWANVSSARGKRVTRLRSEIGNLTRGIQKRNDRVRKLRNRTVYLEEELQGQKIETQTLESILKETDREIEEMETFLKNNVTEFVVGNPKDVPNVIFNSEYEHGQIVSRLAMIN